MEALLGFLCNLNESENEKINDVARFAWEVVNAIYYKVQKMLQMLVSKHIKATLVFKESKQLKGFVAFLDVQTLNFQSKILLKNKESNG